MPILFISSSQTEPIFLLICFTEKHDDAPIDPTYSPKVTHFWESLIDLSTQTGVWRWSSMAAVPGLVLHFPATFLTGCSFAWSYCDPRVGPNPWPCWPSCHWPSIEPVQIPVQRVPALQHTDIPAPLGVFWGKISPLEQSPGRRMCESETYKGLVTSLVLYCKIPDDSVS